MYTKTKYQVVFYVNTEEEVKNLISGNVNPEYYNFQILEKIDNSKRKK